MATFKRINYTDGTLLTVTPVTAPTISPASGKFLKANDGTADRYYQIINEVINETDTWLVSEYFAVTVAPLTGGS